MNDPHDAIVPCGTCTLCCQGDVIALFPEDGDDVASYVTDTISGVTIIKRDGPCCRYLIDGRCSIYERRPVICRFFDCRGIYQSQSRTERKRLIALGLANKAIFDRGRELLAAGRKK